MGIKAYICILLGIIYQINTLFMHPLIHDYSTG